ncbi:hypothetical protein Tco_0755611 [Tanacetum coccineum]
MAELVRLHICDELDDTWAWVAPGLKRQPDAVAGALEVAEGVPDDDEARLEEEVHGLRDSVAEQRGVLDSMAHNFSKFTTWTVTSLSHMMDQSECTSTRSSTRNLFPRLEDPERTIRRRTRVDLNLLNNFEEINKAANEAGNDGPPPAGGDGLLVLDLQTMEELCQPTLNGRGGPISPIAIQATNFGLNNDMIQQVQNLCPFRVPGDDANKRLDKFLHVTQSMIVNGVSNDALRLYLFPYSLQHRAAEFQGILSPPLTKWQKYFSENTSHPLW